MEGIIIIFENNQKKNNEVFPLTRERLKYCIPVYNAKDLIDKHT